RKGESRMLAIGYWRAAGGGRRAAGGDYRRIAPTSGKANHLENAIRTCGTQSPREPDRGLAPLASLRENPTALAASRLPKCTSVKPPNRQTVKPRFRPVKRSPIPFPNNMM